MTGYSWSKAYWKKMVGMCSILVGSFLLAEHLYHYGGFDFELFGHEYTGLAFIIFGFLLNLKWEQWPRVKRAIQNRNWKELLDEGERND